MSENFLHVVTKTGIETYTSRWGAVALESKDKDLGAVDPVRDDIKLKLNSMYFCLILVHNWVLNLLLTISLGSKALTAFLLFLMTASSYLMHFS